MIRQNIIANIIGCTLSPYMYFLHRRFLPGELQTWGLRDVGRPLLAALPIILLGRWLLPAPSTRFMIFGEIGLVWAVAAAAAAFTSSELRQEFIRNTRKVLGISHGK